MPTNPDRYFELIAAVEKDIAAAVAPLLERIAALEAKLAQRVPDERITECARRLVEHADVALGGCLSASSKARDIPSNAFSQVKARHLAALRDALSAAPAAPEQQAKRCPNCDDTGDVHSIDGEWRGVCQCPAGQAINAQAKPEQADHPEQDLAMVDERKAFEAWFEPHWNGAQSDLAAWAGWQARAGLSAQPPQQERVPLTEVQINAIHRSIEHGVCGLAFGMALARAVEAAHHITKKE